jgi:hypothetical protein
MINGYRRTLRRSISCGCDLGRAPDVGYSPIFFDILDEKGFSAHLSNIGHKDQLVKGLAKGRGMRMGCLSRSMSVRLMLRPKYLPWIVSTTDTMPQLVAQEVEKGFVESTSSGYPVVDKSWVDRLSPCEVPFGGDLDLLAVREWAKKFLKVERKREATYSYLKRLGRISRMNRVLIDWPGNLAVGGGYEVDYKKLKSSTSRLKGEF